MTHKHLTSYDKDNWNTRKCYNYKRIWSKRLSPNVKFVNWSQFDWWLLSTLVTAVALLLMMQQWRRATDTDSGLSDILQTPTFRLSTSFRFSIPRLYVWQLDKQFSDVQTFPYYHTHWPKTSAAPMPESLGLVWSQVKIKEWCKKGSCLFYLASLTGKVVSPFFRNELSHRKLYACL